MKPPIMPIVIQVVPNDPFGMKNAAIAPPMARKNFKPQNLSFKNKSGRKCLKKSNLRKMFEF